MTFRAMRLINIRRMWVRGCAKEIFILNMWFPFQVRNLRNKDKPLIRRKSDLPTDSGVARALTSYKRADEFLKTPPDGNKC